MTNYRKEVPRSNVIPCPATKVITEHSGEMGHNRKLVIGGAPLIKNWIWVSKSDFS